MLFLAGYGCLKLSEEYGDGSNAERLVVRAGELWTAQGGIMDCAGGNYGLRTKRSFVAQQNCLWCATFRSFVRIRQFRGGVFCLIPLIKEQAGSGIHES